MMNFSIVIPSFSDLKKFHNAWTWQEIRWGKSNGLLSAADAISYAMETLDESNQDDSDLLNLAIESEDSDSIDQKIAALCCFEEKESDEMIALVWRKTILKWMYDYINDESILQQLINCLYADFDYPKDMRSLIGYMPPLPEQKRVKWDIKSLLRQYIEK